VKLNERIARINSAFRISVQAGRSEYLKMKAEDKETAVEDGFEQRQITDEEYAAGKYGDN